MIAPGSQFIEMNGSSPKPYCLFPRTPGLFSSLNVQRNMLEDRVRLDCFRSAIERSIRPGDTVIDLGTGTGILAIYAARAGARHVYAIEETDVADVAESVIAANGLSNVITVLRANSTQVELHERADVLIAELVGHFFFEEGIVEYVADVRDKLLKPAARIIPGSAEVFLAPVSLGGRFHEISFWTDFPDVNLDAVRRHASNCAYVETVRPEELLAASASGFALTAGDWQPARRPTDLRFRVSRSGLLDAIAGWFRLDLTQGVTLCTSPHDTPTHWQQCVFPLEQPVKVQEGEQVKCEFILGPFGPGCRWQWSVETGSGIERHEVPITYGSGTRLMNERF